MAKGMRQLAGDRYDNFHHLGPFVIEHWHNKRDFLEVNHR